MASTLEALLRRPGPVILDGGLATELMARGADLSGGLWSARALLEEPRRVLEVHRAYARAGAEVLSTEGWPPRSRRPAICSTHRSGPRASCSMHPIRSAPRTSRTWRRARTA